MQLRAQVGAALAWVESGHTRDERRASAEPSSLQADTPEPERHWLDSDGAGARRATAEPDRLQADAAEVRRLLACAGCSVP